MDDGYNLSCQEATFGNIWMRASQAEKDRSHKRIVDGAARLMRERGIQTTSVSDVMTDAGMTIGGFYKHFESKDALVGAALRAAFDEIAALMDAKLSSADDLADYEAFYLSEGHVMSPGIGCPVAALSGDMARGSAALKAEFGAGFRRIVSKLAGSISSPRNRQNEAVCRLAMLAGAVMIARASDQDTARLVLTAVADDL